MKNQRLFTIILVTVLCLTLLMGCAQANATNSSPKNEEKELVVSSDVVGFEEIASYRDGDVTYAYYRCRTTNAMYVWRQYDENLLAKIRPYSGFTAMLDPATNGPLTYENWLTYLEERTQEIRE